jgi:hypothetical protein
MSEIDKMLLSVTKRQHKHMKNRTSIDYDVHKESLKPMTPLEVRKIARHILNKALEKNKAAKLIVRVVPILGKQWTIKSMDQSIDNIQDEDEYTAGRVKEMTKFQEYYRAIFTIVI